MKLNTLLVSFMVLFAAKTFAQTDIIGDIQHGGIVRDYRLHLPTNHDPQMPTPLVINMHGYGSNAFEQEFYSGMSQTANANGFIVVYPNGTFDATAKRFWNAGFGANINDIGFIEALIDSLSASYAIDQNRIYSTGMSNGGIMSYHLACNSSRFAAIASVTGTMSTGTLAACNPTRPMPVMQIHGTADATVPYNGGTTGLQSIPTTLNYWVNYNNCNTTPTITPVPNSNTTDGATAENYLYTNATTNVKVEHYKVINGAHTWPGSGITIGVTCMDFVASTEIWRFFNQYSLTVSTSNLTENLSMAVSPNPTTDMLRLHADTVQEVSVIDMNGKVLLSVKNTNLLRLQELPQGVYMLRILSGNKVYSSKFIKQ